jgi:DNA-binding GntR family transcriptional regulator
MPTDEAPSAANTYDRLKLMILNGEMAVGQPLVERSLAARLGVSRTPIRETIFMLEREGLVRIVEGKGAFVASYTVEDMIEIYHVREGLEPIAARLAVPNLTTSELDYLEVQLNRLNDQPAIRFEAPEEWMRIGREFHTMFIRASHNERLIQTIAGFQDQIDLSRGLGRLIVQTDSDSAAVEHLAILRALQARDPAAAEHAVRVHLQNGLKHRLNRFAQGRGPAAQRVLERHKGNIDG